MATGERTPNGGGEGRDTAPPPGIFEASPAAMLVVSVEDGRIVLANAACHEVFGRPAEELVGRTSLDAGLWTEPERRELLAEEFARDGRLRNVAEEVRLPDGAVRQVLVSAEPIELDGRPYILVQATDVSARAELGRVLRRSEEQLRLFLEHAPILAVVKDLHGRFVFANQRFTDAFVPSGDSPLGRTSEDIFAAETAAASRAAEQRVLETRAPVEIEQAVPDPDGRERTYATVRFPLISDDGEPYGVGIVGSDISERKSAQAELERARAASEAARARLDAVIAAATDLAVIVSDGDGRISIFNNGAERLTGYGAEEWLGKMASALIAALGDPGEIAAHTGLAHGEAGPEAFIGEPSEWTLVRKNGVKAPVEAAVRPVLGAAGRPAGVVMIVRDLSAAKWHERELIDAHAHAVAGERAKAEFLSRMSHELRTPLTAILGFGQLLAADDMPGEQRELVLRMTAAGAHLLALVDDVLDISRGDGAPAVGREPVSIRPAVAEAIVMVEPFAEEHGVRLVVAPTAPAAVWADPLRLRQVLLNLLTNAVKYNRERGEVRVDVRPAGARRVRVAVTDAGLGIGEADRSRLFRPFERLTQERAGVEGTGLGLAVSKVLVEQMGGTIGVDSEPGSGSTFWIELSAAPPRRARRAAGPPDAPPATGAPERSGGATGPVTVLYVEDSESNQYLVERVLGAEPNEVQLVIAGSGAEGLERAAAARPALVLLDLQLPDMPGEEVLCRLRADPATANARIAVVSAEATTAQRDRLRSLGADAYLSKPYPLGELWTQVRAARRQRRSARPRPAAAALDPSKLASLCELDAPGEEGTMARRTLAEAAAEVAEIAEAASARDPARVRYESHRLRTSAAMLGADALVATAAMWEQAATGGAVPSPAQLEELRGSLAGVADAVSGLVTAPPAPRGTGGA